jgi:hypothetical protein
MYQCSDLRIRDARPRADDVADRAARIALGRAKHVEQHREPAGRLRAQEHHVPRRRVLRQHRRVVRVVKVRLARVRRGRGDVRVDEHAERAEDVRPQLGLAVQELREQLRELGRHRLMRAVSAPSAHARDPHVPPQCPARPRNTQAIPPRSGR